MAAVPSSVSSVVRLLGTAEGDGAPDVDEPNLGDGDAVKAGGWTAVEGAAGDGAEETIDTAELVADGGPSGPNGASAAGVDGLPTANDAGAEIGDTLPEAKGVAAGVEGGKGVLLPSRFTYSEYMVSMPCAHAAALPGARLCQVGRRTALVVAPA